MKKSKSLKNLILVLSALLSMIFVFALNATFASSTVLLTYQTDVNKTTAYLENQQYVVVNDTIKNPINYSVGAHSTSVALQYSIGYSFDLRVKYSLEWSDDSLDNSNVELLFANRDNVIIDENYIYYINYSGATPVGLPAGDGKINLISGIEIIDNGNINYVGESLTINIEEVKIYKQTTSYSDAHALYTSGEAGKAWLQHKNSAALTDAYVMMYNYRFTKDMGVNYPGHNSAYSKRIVGSAIDSATWIGGNRAYAGVGMYVITGSNDFEVKAKVSGTWRKADGTGNVQQFDNNIRFNYADGWVNPVLDSNKLFETRELTYIIPANTACYITIVDSIEITCAEIIDIAEYNSQSLVVNEIIVNKEIFSYEGDGDSKITSAVIETEEVSTSGSYVKPDITIINTSKYANNLYEFKVGAAVEQNLYTSTVLLLNNTNKKQKVSLDLGLNYSVSNGSNSLTLADGSRATSFTDSAYYRLDGSVVEDYVTIGDSQEFVLDPYASVDANSVYSVGQGFQTTTLQNTVGSYDAWLEIAATATNEDATEESNLILEINTETSKIYVKNNTDKIVTSLSVPVTLQAYYLSVNTNAAAQKPSDWLASYWKYYTIAHDGSYVQNTSTTWNDAASYYKSENVAASINLTPSLINGGTYTGNLYGNASVYLEPNESMEILSYTINTGSLVFIEGVKFILEGTARAVSTETSQDVLLINNGVNENYIVNNTSNSYYVRFYGDIPDGETFDNVVTETDGLNYYITILRPGQILKTASTAESIDKILVQDEFVFGEEGSLKNWVTAGCKLTNVLQAFKTYFGIE